MTTKDLPGALLARDRMLAIAADPDLTGDTELFAFCLLAYLIERRQTRRKSTNWAEKVGEMMMNPRRVKIQFGSDSVVTDGAWKCRRIIADDIPRYQTPPRDGRGCIALKSRGPNVGKPCGKGGTLWLDRDPETGQGQYLSYCDRHMPVGAKQSHRERYQQWVENGKPSPPANTGGVLARHFRADWAKLYAWADPHTTPLPDGKPATPLRPRLSIIDGGLS